MTLWIQKKRRRLHPLLICAALLSFVLATLLSPGWSSADTVRGAIVNAAIRQDAVTAHEGLTLDISWRVPDGTQAGDTFSLALPPELTAHEGTRFDLLDDAGQVVARASVTGGIVLFVLTDYPVGRVGIHGTAYLGLTFRDVPTPGVRPVVFTADGVAFRDAVTVSMSRPNDYSATATKWVKFVSPGGAIPAGADLMWAIAAPRITSLAPITFIDTPGPGQTIVCSGFVVVSGRNNINGGVTGAAPGYAAGVHYRVTECSAERAVVVLTPGPVHIGTVPMLIGFSSVTDASLSEYRNSGAVTVAGVTTRVQTFVKSAGGTGNGTPAPTATSTTRTTSTTTPPVDETTTTPPVDETSATPPVGSGTSTSTPPPTSDGTTTTTPPVETSTTPPAGETITTPPVGSGTSTPPPTSDGTTTTTPPVETPTITPPVQTGTTPAVDETSTTPPVGSGTSTLPPTSDGTSTTTPPVGSGTSPPPPSDETSTTPPPTETSTTDSPIATATPTTPAAPTPEGAMGTPPPGAGPRIIDTGVAAPGPDLTLVMTGLIVLVACGVGLIARARAHRDS